MYVEKGHIGKSVLGFFECYNIFMKSLLSFRVSVPPFFFFTPLFMVFLSFWLLPFLVFSETVLFTRGLGLGFRGDDVLLLQQFLNNDPDTRVAVLGPGSLGFETNFFGPLTKIALHKFQKKYASEILYPGQAPTGYIGPKTLRKINLLLKERQAQMLSPKLSVQEVEIAKPKVISTTEPVKQPEIFGVSPEKVRLGDKVIIIGKNFSSEGNTVLLRYAYIEARFENLPSSDGKTIVFTYAPPKVRTMTKSELLAMPQEIQKQLINSAIPSPVFAEHGTRAS